MNCPKCNGQCHRDSVDIGVGVIHGPYGCEECGWSEDPEYDLSTRKRPCGRSRRRDRPVRRISPAGLLYGLGVPDGAG
jgi:hypothetical protein